MAPRKKAMPWDDRSKWMPSVRQMRHLHGFGFTREQQQIISVALDIKLAKGPKARINEVLAELPDAELLMRLHGVVGVWHLASEFGIPDWDKVRELNDTYLYDSVRAGVDQDDLYDESGDFSEAYLKREQDVEMELFNQWRDAVIQVTERQLRQMGADLVYATSFQAPELSSYVKVDARVGQGLAGEGWPEAFRLMVDCIQGVGHYTGDNDKEILDGLTHKEWVISNWIEAVRVRPRIFDGTTIVRLYERAWR